MRQKSILVWKMRISEKEPPKVSLRVDTDWKLELRIEDIDDPILNFTRDVQLKKVFPEQEGRASEFAVPV